ncbi:LysR family transcriptional regulator [Niveispirillum sp.]|uniref:LysR family transcriptional regulator n=1 Tax=Niveispirillum sp. TaxID=1917217 RepID=UPI001B4A753F|nr:LysR family transcriptional regulator [Niveispirillum sp.]MBP7336039.1 LysR family transcriptional regulator [Niveispirillum sp.]
MRFQKLDLNLLVVLDVLLEERSVSRAANRLNLSQSAVSGNLARLREFFDDDILAQIGRSMVPTPLAESLAEPVRDILMQIQAAIETKPSFDPASATRTIRMHASDYVTEVLLARVIREARGLAPGIKVEIDGMDDLVLERLSRGHVDFVITPDNFTDPDHPKEKLFTDTHVVVVWEGNTKVADTISFEQYMALSHVLVRFGQRRAPSFDQWFLDRFGHSRNAELFVADFTTVPSMLIGTDLLATMHERLARLYVQRLPLRILPLPIEFPVLTEMVQWHRHFQRDPALVWFRSLMRRCAAEQDAG